MKRLLVFSICAFLMLIPSVSFATDVITKDAETEVISIDSELSFTTEVVDLEVFCFNSIGITPLLTNTNLVKEERLYLNTDSVYFRENWLIDPGRSIKPIKNNKTKEPARYHNKKWVH